MGEPKPRAKDRVTLAEQESQQCNTKRGGIPQAEDKAEGQQRRDTPKKSVVWPSRLQPSREVKIRRMPSQQELEAEKEARKAADRRSEELTQTMQQMREEFAAWKKSEEERRESDVHLLAEMQKQLQQETDARRAAAEEVITVRREVQEAAALLARLQTQVEQRGSEATAPGTSPMTTPPLGGATLPAPGTSPTTTPPPGGATLPAPGAPAPPAPGAENSIGAGSTRPPPGFGLDPSSVLWLQQAANVMRAGVDVSARATIPFSMTADQLPKFSAEDASQPVKAWLRRVDDDALMYAWTVEQKLVAARRALEGAARKWLDGHSGLSTWDELKTGLIEAFGRRIHASDIHDMMRQRRKKKEESILAYVQEMEYLGSQGELSEDDVRRYITRGVTDDTRTQFTISTVPKESFVHALEMHDHDFAEKEDPKDQGHKMECFQCGQRGHIARFCKQEKEITCYKCEEKGHKASNCPKKKASGGKVNRVCTCKHSINSDEEEKE